MTRRTIILSALPLLILVLYVGFLGFNMPFWDQWDFVPVLAHMKEGTLSFADLIAQNNEHRPLFPRLLWLGLARLTGYNIKAELWLNLGIAVATFGGFVAYTVWVWRKEKVEGTGALLPLLALLIFNLAQWETWLWGFQTSFLLGMMGVVLGFIVLARFDNWYGLLGSALLGTVATFSMANAVLYWPIGLLVIAACTTGGRRWIRVTTWLIISAVNWTVFFRGWTPTSMASLSVLWKHPIIYSIWVLNFIGAPLLTYWYAWVFGILSLVWLAVVGSQVFKTRDFRRVAPYAAIIVFILGSALATGVGRSSVSLTSSVASRYVTQNAWYWASLLSLLPLSQVSDNWQRLAKAMVLVMLTVCMVGGGLLGYYWRYLRILPAYDAVKHGRSLTDQELGAISPSSPTVVRERLNTLCQYNWSACRK